MHKRVPKQNLNLVKLSMLGVRTYGNDFLFLATNSPVYRNMDLEDPVSAISATHLSKSCRLFRMEIELLNKLMPPGLRVP